ncbi:hypothetical protein NW766_007784 [Fusarium irregulare]|uniref:Rhodopsin domain-containing protein n=1 Tax=Fusarium irregulare TaxID=2494466 RepID=A0A9W8PNS9_9HYPO|nr:hypothetical protein NW766_007784 [Fusarium irregulare]
MGVRDTYYPLVISCLVVDGIAVSLRLWARRLKRAIGYDDIVMWLSFVRSNLSTLFFTTSQIAYILTTGISKLGVGLVLLRLASGADMRTVRIILIMSMIIVTLWCLVTTLIFGLQCRPLSVAWGVGGGSCLSTSVLGTTGLALSGMDVTISWFYALLPIYMLYKTQLRLRLKIMIMVLLGLGAVSSIAIIVRLKYLIDLSRLTSASGGLASQEAVETTLEGTIYSILEIGLSILAASLTALRPLLTRLPGFGDSSSKAADFGSLVTFGNRNDNKGPAYRLEDRDVSVTDSQENIVPPRPLTSRSSIVPGRDVYCAGAR